MKFNKLKTIIKRYDGITIIEVIVVLVILAILAAIIVPSLIGYIDSSKKKICEVNRLTILRHYKTYLILEPGYSLSEYLEFNSKNMQCPSGGTYTVVENTHTHEETLNCSKHGALKTNTPSVTSTLSVTATPLPTPSTKQIPSTDVDVNSTWPEDSVFFDGIYPKRYDIFMGQTYYYGGQYYIVTHDVIDLYLSSGIPTPTNGWWYKNGVVPINDRVIRWDGGTTDDFNLIYKDNLPKQGDICYCLVNGVYDYYVFTIAGQTWIDPPNHNMLNWIKLNDTYPRP